MRYGPAENLIRLMVMMASSQTGVTIDDVRREFGISRRTAERMIDAARRIAEVEEGPDCGDQRKRWRIRKLPPILADPAAADLAALATAAERLRADGLSEHAERIETLSRRITATLERGRAVRLAPDLEVLSEAEGFASRPGPRQEIDPEVFAALRQAVLGSVKVRLSYVYRTREGDADVVVHPYGFLYGSRHYLVAFSEADHARDVRSFALPNIRSVEILEEGFAPVQGFSMEGYAREMFGLFREPPTEVTWRFSREAARDARTFRFHPDQRVEELPDGRLEVSFRAGGLREMAFHLFTWGEHVEIVSPPELRKMLVDMLRTGLSHHAG